LARQASSPPESSVRAIAAETPGTAESDAQVVRPRIPTNVPSVYADQIMDVVFGLHTTKLIFGIENGSGVQPVGVAVLPTAALLLSVLAIRENLTSPGMVEEMGNRFAGVIKMMRQEQASESSGTLVKKKDK
jgi:hypothetical protein